MIRVKTVITPNTRSSLLVFILEEEAIFLFTSMEAVEDAVLNWFGDEVGEEVPLGVLKVTLPDSWEENIFVDPNVGYEAVCKAPIPPEFIQEYYTEIDF